MTRLAFGAKCSGSDHAGPAIVAHDVARGGATPRVEQRRQRQRADASRRRRPRNARGGMSSRCQLRRCKSAHRLSSLVMVSCRLSIDPGHRVQAASSAGSSVGSDGRLADLRSARPAFGGIAPDTRADASPWIAAAIRSSRSGRATGRLRASVRKPVRSVDRRSPLAQDALGEARGRPRRRSGRSAAPAPAAACWSAAARRCTPRGWGRRRPAGWGGGTSAASRCRARGGTGPRPCRRPTRALGKLRYAQ